MLQLYQPLVCRIPTYGRHTRSLVVSRSSYERRGRPFVAPHPIYARRTRPLGVSHGWWCGLRTWGLTCLPPRASFAQLSQLCSPLAHLAATHPRSSHARKRCILRLYTPFHPIRKNRAHLAAMYPLSSNARKWHQTWTLPCFH